MRAQQTEKKKKPTNHLLETNPLALWPTCSLSAWTRRN